MLDEVELRTVFTEYEDAAIAPFRRQRPGLVDFHVRLDTLLFAPCLHRFQSFRDPVFETTQDCFIFLSPFLTTAQT